MEKRTWVKVKSNFEALHRWKEADNFLKDYHRHIFYVDFSITVDHNDREIEFFELKKELKDFLRIKYQGKSIDMSCEMFAGEIIDFFRGKYPKRMYKCEVSEDGENSAVIECFG